MKAKSSIIIYNTSFFEGSETFIYNQYLALVPFSPVLIAHSFKNLERFPLQSNSRTISVSKIPIGFKERLIHFLRRKRLNLPYLLPLSSERQLEKGQENIQGIHAHFGPNAMAILPFAKRNTLPLVVSFHGYDASQMLQDSRYTNSLQQLFDYATAVIVCADKMKQDLLAATNTNYSKKIHVIHYGVDVDFISSVPTRKKEAGVIHLIHAGRLTAKKGVLDLIRVFNAVRISLPHIKLQLDIVGDGEDMNAALDLRSDLGLSDYVHFYGAVSHQELIAHVKSASIFVLNSRVSPSGDSEGFPNSILEAMAAGTAVVSTYHAGIPEVVLHEETGLLVREKDNEGLEAALIRLIQSEELRDQLSQQALRQVRQKFSLVQMNRRITNLMDNL